jgi:serine/threonine protein kinase
VGRTLGSGVSGKVKEGILSDGTIVAVKIFQKANKNAGRLKEYFKNEIKKAESLDHPSLVKILAYNSDAIYYHKSGKVTKIFYIAQELVTGGELFDFVAFTGAFSEQICRFYFKQLLLGLHYLHSNGICHRDLKPENILLDREYNCKIIDFGFATELKGKDGSGFMYDHLGTTGYMAPEILNNCAYQGQVVDLFALGVVLFTLYAARKPFNQAHQEHD